MCVENVKRIQIKIAFVTIPVLLLAATVAISVIVSEDVFASDSTSQAASVSNECLNPILDSNSIDNLVDVGNCAGTVSQQDESGSASAPITSQTANPDIELQRATTTQPPLTGTPPSVEGCVACFDVLSDDQKILVQDSLNVAGGFPTTITTFEELCMFAINAIIDGEDPETIINQLENVLSIPENGLSPAVQSEIVECFERNIL